MMVVIKVCVNNVSPLNCVSILGDKNQKNPIHSIYIDDDDD